MRLQWFLPFCVKSTDSETNIYIGSQIIRHLENHGNSEHDSKDVTSLIIVMRQWLISSNYEVVQNAIKILSILAKRMKKDFKPYITQILKSCIYHLGQSKYEVRLLIRDLMLTLMKYVTSPQDMFKELRNTFNHKEWRVREEITMLLQKVLNKFGTSSLKICAVIGPLFELLCDPSSRVRDAAVSTCVMIFKYADKSARVEIIGRLEDLSEKCKQDVQINASIGANNRYYDVLLTQAKILEATSNYSSAFKTYKKMLKLRLQKKTFAVSERMFLCVLCHYYNWPIGFAQVRVTGKAKVYGREDRKSLRIEQKDSGRTKGSRASEANFYDYVSLEELLKKREYLKRMLRTCESSSSEKENSVEEIVSTFSPHSSYRQCKSSANENSQKKNNSSIRGKKSEASMHGSKRQMSKQAIGESSKQNSSANDSQLGWKHRQTVIFLDESSKKKASSLMSDVNNIGTSKSTDRLVDHSARKSYHVEPVDECLKKKYQLGQKRHRTPQSCDEDSRKEAFSSVFDVNDVSTTKSKYRPVAHSTRKHLHVEPVDESLKKKNSGDNSRPVKKRHSVPGVDESSKKINSGDNSRPVKKRHSVPAVDESSKKINSGDNSRPVKKRHSVPAVDESSKKIKVVEVKPCNYTKDMKQLMRYAS